MYGANNEQNRWGNGWAVQDLHHAHPLPHWFWALLPHYPVFLCSVFTRIFVIYVSTTLIKAGGNLCRDGRGGPNMHLVSHFPPRIWEFLGPYWLVWYLTSYISYSIILPAFSVLWWVPWVRIPAVYSVLGECHTPPAWFTHNITQGTDISFISSHQCLI